jgi:hypothetical protein
LDELKVENIIKGSSIDLETTKYPFCLNVINPNKNKYQSPNCLLCGMRSCSNCPLPLSYNQSLRDLLKDIMEPNFSMNDIILQHQDD